jgi:hypothetical protein
MFKRPIKLDFLIAGVQKGATSALWHFLRQHPDICFAEQKELHFFDDDSVDWSNPPYDKRYHAHFDGAQPGQLRAEATPAYAYWPPAAARMHAYNPELKLIISLRDPVARAYSHWRMVSARGVENLSFSDAIRAGRSRVTQQSENPRSRWVYSYVERGFYYQQMRRILDLFPREQVLFISSSALRSRFCDTLDEICGFVGVAPFLDYPVAMTVHSYKNNGENNIATADACYLDELYKQDLMQTQALVGLEIEREIRV